MFKALGLRSASAGLFAIILLAGCGRKDADPDASAETSSEEAPASNEDAATSTQPAENPVRAPLTSADIDRWDKGMAGELKAIQDAAQKIKTARSGADTLSAMMGVQEMATIGAGAQAAGLEQERYKFVRSNLSAVVAYLTPSQGGIDTTLLSQAQRDEMRQMNEAQIQRMQQEVPAEVVEALKPRAVELRKKDLELVAARLKGAGMQ